MPTLKDIADDRELHLNPNLDKQTLKEKFFFSKIPSQAIVKKSPRKPNQQSTFQIEQVPEIINDSHSYALAGLPYRGVFRPYQ